MTFNLLDRKRVKIAHLADIHIKDIRREEYSKVFEKLYKKLRSENPDIIAICGDIFHDKTKASALNYLDVENFLSTLVQIAPVVLIPGNHDLNVKVPGTPDLISPVVSNHTILREPHFIYWRNSGIYVAHGIVWIVIAPDGPQPSRDEIEKTLLNSDLKNTAWICLIHETIDGALLYNETLLRERRLAPKDLATYDAVLAGDIHLQQNIGGNQRAMYAGSLIQQDIGESHTGHGFLVWELELSSEHLPYRTAPPQIHRISIPNEQGFLKVQLEAGRDITKQPCPTRPNYYEIIYDEATTEKELTFHIEHLTKIYGILPQATRLVKKLPGTISENDSSILSQAQVDAQSLTIHEEIIRDILGEKNPYLQQVIELHQKNYLKVLNHERTRARIRLLKLKFNNIYCYGPDNVIDFTKLENSLSGAIAPNRAGKSSLIDIIVFALYDKYPRAEKKSNIINNRSSQYYLLLEFELDGKQGYIEKKGLFKRNSHFGQYKFVYDNQELTQGTNTLTCQKIEKLVGTYDNAELTSILHQDNHNDFIWLRPNERKQVLARLLALGSFEKLEKEVKEENSKLNVKIELLKDNFQGKEVIELFQERENAINLNNEKKNKIQELDKKIKLKERDKRDFLKEKEELIINLTRIEDKIKNLGPEISINLTEAEKELEKISKIISIDNDLSPTEEYNTYLFQSFDTNFTDDIDFYSVKIPTRYEVLNVISQARLTQKNKQEKESKILAEITRLEAQKLRISTLWETSVKNLQQNCTKIKVNFKTFKIETLLSVARPTEQEPPWPVSQKGLRPIAKEILEAKNDLVNFWEEKELVRNVILQKLAIISDNLIPPIQDEKEGEYKNLLTSIEKDQELIRDKNSLEINWQATKLKLQNAQSIEKSQRKDLVKKVKNNPQNAESFHFLDMLSLQQEINETKVKLLTAENAQQIRRQLKLQEGCPGCEHNKNLFAENKVKIFQKRLEEALFESVALTVYNTRLAEKEVKKIELDLQKVEDAQKRINRLAEIQIQHEELLNYKKKLEEKNHWERKMIAVEIMEKASYWWEEDKKFWKEHDLAIAQLEEMRNLQKELSLISQKISESRSLLTELTNVEDEALRMEKDYINLRKLGLKKIISVSQNIETVKNSLKTRMERQQLKNEYHTIGLKLDEWKKRIILLESELTELRSQRDKIMSSLITSESEITRINESITEEKKRMNSLTATQRKNNVITAYRRILDPKTGIADYLLKKSRFYLEDVVNSILEECRALFRVYISNEFELSISSNNQSKKYHSEQLLSASLGSGYQKFTLSLALRAALWKLAEVPLLDCQFIDEGFGCCDEDNLESITQYLVSSTFSPNAPRIIFIVSHIEALKNAIQKPLIINIESLGSKIDNEK